jgi:hypothetical protein
VSLLGDVQYCYSRAVKPTGRTFLAIWFALNAACFARAATPPQSVDAANPRDVYKALNDLRVDPVQVYAVSNLPLRRAAVSLIFSDGFLGFLQAYDGRVTGIVFSGQGHITAIPGDPAEKQSLAYFQGVPVLDRSFSRAYLRFDDGAADDVLADLRSSGAQPLDQPEFVREWNKSVENLNPEQSSRLLMDFLSETPTPFFYANLLDDQLGAYDVLIDGRRRDSVLIGQRRWGNSNSSYSVWASFGGSSTRQALPAAFNPTSYEIETTIGADRILRGAVMIDLRAVGSGERGIELELSQSLKVVSAQDSDGRPLEYFQNESSIQSQVAEDGNDALRVFLPQSARAGQSYRISLTYRGALMTDAEKGTFIMGDHGSWYPRIGGMSHFVPYDMTFRWPKRLRMVASGTETEEREEGDQRIGRWRSDGPIAVAGFNLGSFEIENAGTVEGVKIEVATRGEDDSVVTRGQGNGSVPQNSGPIAPTERDKGLGQPGLAGGTQQSPSARWKDLAMQVGKAIRAERQWMGQFPAKTLVVSQGLKTQGQGWPGLIALSATAFQAPSQTTQRAGTDPIPGSMGALAPYREVARQWWGYTVGWENYSDQWVTEGLANYLALVAADSEVADSHLLMTSLANYRDALTTASASQSFPADAAGPLVYGVRLNANADPDAYSKVISGKGAWVFHMLRMMMQDPASKKPDERFAALLQSLLETHRHSALTTEELQRGAERVMTPAMAIEGGHSLDWFFEEYVRSTGIPTYDLDYTVRPGGRGFILSGKLLQANVPDDFVQRVPIYAQFQSGKLVFIGSVVTSGDETAFQFATSLRPLKLAVDPQMTLLCVPVSKAASAGQ